MSKTRWSNIVLWTLQVLLTFVYVNVGRTKFTQQEGWAAAFRGWGYPEGFYLLVGALEVLGGFALLHPRTVSYGAGTLMAIMCGASVTHIIHGPPRLALLTGVLMLILGFLAWARRPGWLRKRQPE